MIRAEHHDNALRSLHAIFVWLRVLSSERTPYEVLKRACDVAEELPTLFLRDEDLTDYFRTGLEELVKIHEGFGLAIEHFDGKAR
jgi:hypothetical protein